MASKIDYYFTCISPFTYIGHRYFLRIAKAADVTVNFKPLKLGEVFAESGALPLPQRPISRQKYRLLELERWAKKRGLPINTEPAFFPASPLLADKCAIALQEIGGNAGDFIEKVLSACWVHEKDIAEESTIREIISSIGALADEVIDLALSDKVEAIYSEDTSAAIEQGVLGSPSYVFNGEQFWGQDRIELLSEYL